MFNFKIQNPAVWMILTFILITSVIVYFRPEFASGDGGKILMALIALAGVFARNEPPSSAA